MRMGAKPVSRGAAAATALLMLLSACGGGGAASDAGPTRHVSAVELGQIVLPASDAPEGTEYLPERSGTIPLEELWPSDCCPSQQLAFEDAGFSTAYARVFLKPGHSDDPIDTRAGWELVSSAALLFKTPEGATEAMDSWLGYYESPVLEALPADDLGDEAVAVTGSPNAPAEVFFLYLWRIDRALLALRVSAGSGTVTGEQVRELVDRMNSRVS
ncbi:MAG: hypothetical protein ACRDHM_08060 [Actinomycetota bacterium]